MITVGLITAGVFAVVFGMSVARHNRALTADDEPPPRVVAFELAGTGHAAHALLMELGAVGRARMRSAIGTDRWIIAGYAPGLAVLSLLSIWVVREVGSGSIETVGVVLAVLMAVVAIVAGLLDLIENANLIKVLDGWAEPDVAPGDRGEARAAIQQRTRRELIALFDQPSGSARTAAVLKFELLAVVLLWGSTVGVIALTHYVH